MLSLALGVPAVGVFVITPPLGLFYLLYKQRSTRLYNDCTKVRYLFLYHSYKEKFYYWEPVKMMFIFALVCVKVFGVVISDLERLAIFMFVLVSFTMLVVALRPHDFAVLFALELVGLGLVILATYLLQFAYFETSESFTVGESSFNGVVIFMGLLFVLYAILLFLSIVRKFLVE